MATTHTYANGAGAYLRYGVGSTPTTALSTEIGLDEGGTTVRLDSFTVVEDIPGEAISPIGSSYGEAQSAGIVNYSGTFAGRVLLQGSSDEQAELFSTEAMYLNRTIIRASTKVFFRGPIILSGRSIDASGGSVVAFSGNWMGADGFRFKATSSS